jgi:phosphonate degradation associated HDIG domain protein
MALQIGEITELFTTQGSNQYGSEPINQLQHALQSAHLAELSGATPELVCAALLHDLGHMLSGQVPELALHKDDVHQYKVVPFLRGVFPAAVIEPIRLHVDAKRYLCATDPAYWVSLSAASKRTLELQGGPFCAELAKAFIEQDFALDAVALRQWDDQAKDPSACPPEWSHFLAVLQRSCLNQ